MEPLEQGRVVQSRSNDVGGPVAVEVKQVIAYLRLERDRKAGVAAFRAGERPGALVDPVQSEVRPQPVEGLERDAPVRRQLAAGNAQHRGAADRVDRLPPCAHAFARASGQDAQPRVRCPHETRVEELRPECDRCLVEDLSDVRCRHRDRTGVGFVLRVRRPEQEHPVPRHREGDAHVVLRDRERSGPPFAARDQDVHPLAQPHRRAGTGILEAPHLVDPRPCRVDDRAGLDADRLPVGAHRRAGDATGDRAELDNLGAVEHDCSRVGGRADVCQTQACVVRPRIRVERART